MQHLLFYVKLIIACHFINEAHLFIMSTLINRDKKKPSYYSGNNAGYDLCKYYVPPKLFLFYNTNG